MDKLALRPLQKWGKSGVSRPYRRNRASRHSCAPISVAASSAIPPSSSPSEVNMRLGLGGLLGSPPGPPLPVEHSASAPPSFPLGGMRSGLPSVNPTGPWVLRRVFLWWHRTLSSSQGPFSSDQVGPGPPVSQVGTWPLSLMFPLSGPGRGPEWRLPAVPVPLGQRRPWCRGWPAAQITIPVGVNSAVLRKQTASACERPPTEFSPNLCITVLSLTARCPRPPCCQQKPQGTNSQWRHLSPYRQNIPTPFPNSSGTLPRYYWLVPVSSPAVDPSSASPESVPGCALIPSPPPRHTRTMVGWRKGVPPGALWW